MAGVSEYLTRLEIILEALKQKSAFDLAEEIGVLSDLNAMEQSKRMEKAYSYYNGKADMYKEIMEEISEIRKEIGNG